MSSRKPDPPESVLKRWVGFMTSSISRSSTSSESTQRESETSRNERKTKRPIDADSDTKRRRLTDTPLIGTKDNQPSPVSPAQSPLTERPEEGKASTKQRLDKMFQTVASNDVTPSDKASESSQLMRDGMMKPTSKQDSFASNSADDDSSVVILDGCKQANLQIPKEVKESRKSQAYRRSIYESVRRESSLSSEKSNEDSDASQDTDDSSIIIVKETSPRTRQSHPQGRVPGLGRFFPSFFESNSDQDSSVAVLERPVQRYKRSSSSTSDSSAESEESSKEHGSGKRHGGSVTRRQSSIYDDNTDTDSSVNLVKHSPGRRFDSSVARRRSSSPDSTSDSDGSVVFLKQSNGALYTNGAAHCYSEMSECKSDSDSSVEYLKSTFHLKCDSSVEYITQSPGKRDNNASDSDSATGSSIQYIKQSLEEKYNRSAPRHSTMSESSQSECFVEVVHQSPGGRFSNIVTQHHAASTLKQSSSPASNDAHPSSSTSKQSSGPSLNAADRPVSSSKQGSNQVANAAHLSASTSNHSSSPGSNDAKRPAILPGSSSFQNFNYRSQRDLGGLAPTNQNHVARHAVKQSPLSGESASPTGRSDFRGRGDPTPGVASPKGPRSSVSSSNRHSMRRKRIKMRLLARRPTWDTSVQYTGPAKKRKNSSTKHHTPQIYKFDHPNRNIFLSASAPTGHRLSREQILALAKNPTKPVEGGSDSIEHTAQMYKFDDFHQMMILAQVTDAPPVSKKI
jgi:hypothetical protein